MTEKINEEVSVAMIYSAKHKSAVPHLINWQNTDYKVGKIGYHHKIKDGSILHHIFELVDKDNSLWFRINFNTDNLHWLLEEVSDGRPS